MGSSCHKGLNLQSSQPCHGEEALRARLWFDKRNFGLERSARGTHVRFLFHSTPCRNPKEPFNSISVLASSKTWTEKRHQEEQVERRVQSQIFIVGSNHERLRTSLNAAAVAAAAVAKQKSNHRTPT